MVITKTDGTQITIQVAEIDNVTFPSDDRLILDIAYRNFWLHPGQWVRLNATCSTADGEPVYPDELTWKSTDESVASVDQDGVVTGVGEGSCRIIASAAGSQAEMAISVTPKPMFDIQMEQIGNRTCSYSITPSDPSLRYYSLLRIQHGDYSMDGMVQYGSEEQNVFHFALDWWQFCADLYGGTWLEFMNESGLSAGVTHESHDDLTRHFSQIPHESVIRL